MTVTKTTAIDNIGYDPAGRGDLYIRLAKRTWSDGVLLDERPHRLVVEAGDNIDVALSRINAHIGTAGYPAIPGENAAELKALAERRWTPARLQAREARDAKAREDAERERQANALREAAEREQAEKVAAEAATAEEARVRALLKRIAAEERAKV